MRSAPILPFVQSVRSWGAAHLLCEFGVVDAKPPPCPASTPGHHESCENFGFWGRLLLFCGGASGLFLVGGLGWDRSVPWAALFLLLGTSLSTIPLSMVLGIWGYSLASLAMLCIALLTNFYLGETRATISKETLRTGNEFEFTYMQRFKRRTSVRKLRAQLMVRTVSSYETEVGADGEVGMMNERKDEVLQEAERPG